MNFLHILGETRRLPVREGEFIRCGEEYIPYFLFRELGGTAIDFGKRKEVLETKFGLVYRQKTSPRLGPLRTILTDEKLSKSIKNVLAENNIEFAIVHTFLPKTFEMLRKKGVPIILTSHGGFVAFQNYSIWKKPFTIFRKEIEKKAIEKVDALVAINKYMLKEYELYRVEKPKFLIYSGVDTNLYFPSREKWRENTKILYLSRLNRQKGIFDFINLAKNFPEHEFIVVGCDLNNTLPKIKEEIRNIKNIKLFANVSEERKRILLSKAHVFVSLSKGYDPTPNVLYEAMGSEIAIVSTLRHFREDVLGKNAIFVTRNDVKEKLAWLLENKKEIKKRAKKFRKIAEKKFNVKIMAKKYKKVVNSLA